jgi:hypothetical protein
MHKILFIKAAGNPNHNPINGRFASFPVDGRYTAWLPSSDGISSLAGAEKYYQANLAGIWDMTIHRKAGDRKVKVNFNQNKDHAYTKDIDGVRVFEPARAKRMCMIFEAIVHPGVVLENGSRDLFVERVAKNGDHDVVVLEWHDGAKEYRFRSSHYWSHEEFNFHTGPTNGGGYSRAALRGKPGQKVETPTRLSKSSGVPATFPNLHLTTLEGSFELGATPTGSCVRLDGSVGFMADLVKAKVPDWTVLFKANPTPAQAITLVMPSGNRHTIAPGDYAFDDYLAKAELAPGIRWVTLHPNGPGTKGTPVMVQEAQHGSGVFHVVGGAGGKLNYLKLHGLAPESSYKQEASERAKAKTEVKKQQAARDKELGLDKGKGKAREAVSAQKHQGQKQFIETVAKKMGWSEGDLKGVVARMPA